MTTRGGLQSVCVRPSPPVPTPTERFAPVCSASAPSPSRPRRRVILSAACVGFAPLRHAFLPRGGVLGCAVTLGNSPRTR